MQMEGIHGDRIILEIEGEGARQLRDDLCELVECGFCLIDPRVVKYWAKAENTRWIEEVYVQM